MDPDFKKQDQVVVHKPSVEQPFKTPDQVSAETNLTNISPITNTATDQVVEGNENMPKKKRKFWPPSKKGWLIIGIVVVLLGAGIYSDS